MILGRIPPRPRMARLKFYQTDEFKIQEDYWNRKLHREGFNDHEVHSRNGRILKTVDPLNYIRNYQAGTAEYYSLVSQNILQFKFECVEHRIIMEMVADGLKPREIVEKLKTYTISYHRMTIGYIIRRYEHIWGIRRWTAKQRNLKHG
jgi:hypothetical protein